MVQQVSENRVGPHGEDAPATASGNTESSVASALDEAGKPRSREPAFHRLFLGGAVGTMATMLMKYFVVAQLTGGARDQPRSVRQALTDPHGVGVIVLHVFDGVILFPFAFAFLSVRLPGPAFVKGIAWGAILWALGRSLVMPIAGFGFFGATSAGTTAAFYSLAGHLVYGALLGLIAGSRPQTVPSNHAHRQQLLTCAPSIPSQRRPLRYLNPAKPRPSVASLAPRTAELERSLVSPIPLSRRPPKARMVTTLANTQTTYSPRSFQLTSFRGTLLLLKVICVI